MQTDTAGIPGSIAQRIRDFRATCPGITTQQEFAQALGIDQQRLSGYEHGTRVPAHVLAALVTLGANPYWLLFGEGSMRKGDTSEDIRDATLKEVSAINASQHKFSQEQLAEFYILPLYSDEVAAGEPLGVRDTEIEGPAIIHRSWCPNPQQTDCLRISQTGNSMEPTIPAGSMVTIDRSCTNPENLLGKIIAIVKHEGGVTIKRLQKTERNKYVGIPDNPGPDNLPIPLEEGDRIAGLVRTVHARLC